MDQEHREFAERFNLAVEEAGVPSTQAALGKLCGVSGTMAWHYKNGTKLPAMGTAIRISRRLNVCVEWLLTGRGPKRPQDKEIAAEDHLDLSQLSSESKAALRAVFHAMSEPAGTKKAANHDT